MVITWLVMPNMFSTNFSLQKTGCSLMLCTAFLCGGSVFAQDQHNNTQAPAMPTDPMSGHGHGVNHHQAHSATLTPIREVMLPEGLSSAQSMSIDSTGRVWFTEKVGKNLAMYDPDKKEFAIHPLPASWGKIGFSNMAMAPDGDIWFTVTRWIENAVEPNILGRFSPADGYFTKYAIPHGAIPEELTVDSNGAVWFIASNKNHLYRVDPKTFALKGYPIPTADGNPKSLAADQNGHIWFAESTANKIGEFVPGQEVFYEHELLTQFANPGKISIDKQGRVWFVEVTANRIGVYTPEHKRFDEVIIPTPSSSPVALINDDHGNVWFLEYKGNKVGVFNPEKAIFHEFDIPSFGSLPADMAIDRKRSLLWFTQSSTEAKRLGVIAIDEALAEINKQNNARLTAPAEKTSDGSMTKWLAYLVAFMGIGILVVWLVRRSRKGRPS